MGILQYCIVAESSSPCDANPCENSGTCTPVQPLDITDATFQCNCTGTGFDGPTCNRGIIQTPLIPTLFQNEMSMFNISAKPPSDLVIGLNSPRLSIKPKLIILNRKKNVASFEVSGKAGQYTLRYFVSGSVSDEFEVPESAPILVSTKRDSNHINNYFRLLRTEPGIVRESCCQPDNFVYSECPMSTNRVVFRSTCAWRSSDTQHETSGVVFAQYKTLSLPLSINGIEITYDNSGSISSRLSLIPISSCKPCTQNRGVILNSKPLKSPTCYYHKFTSGDVEDMLRSYSLANTFIDRLRGIFPSWFKVSIPTTAISSYQDIDFVASLVKKDDIATIGGCENIVAEDVGLYALLQFQRTFEVSIDGNSVLHSSSDEQDSTPVCVAINLCKGTESPIYIGISQSVQSAIRQLPVMAPYNQDGWQYTVKAITLYNAAASLTATGTFWNGTERYEPDMSEFDLTVNAQARITESLTSSSLDIDFEGDVFNHFLTEEVTANTIARHIVFISCVLHYRKDSCTLMATLC